MRKIKALAVALLLCLCSICYAQQNGAIDRNLQSLLAENPSEKISVNIVLKSQPEPSRMKAIASNARERKAARSMVVKEFKEYSALKQSALMDYLDEAAAAGLVSDISCHWLANAITCNAAKEVVEALASHPDVLAIGCNKDFQIVHSFEATGNEAVAMATSHSATPHVLQVNADGQLRVFDVQGRLCAEIPQVKIGNTVNMRNLPKGLYIVEIGSKTTKIVLK